MYYFRNRKAVKKHLVFKPIWVSQIEDIYILTIGDTFGPYYTLSFEMSIYMIASMYSVTGTPSLVQYVTAGGHFYVEGDTSSQGYSRWARMVPRVCLDTL